MAIVATSGAKYWGDLVSWVASFNCPIITASGSTITFGDKLYTSNGNTYIYNGSQIGQNGYNNRSNTPTLIVSKNFANLYSRDGGGRGFQFLCLKAPDGTLYYGYKWSDGNWGGLSWQPIENFTMNDPVEGVSYAYAKMLNYTAESGKVDFLDFDVLTSANKCGLLCSDLKACSTVTAGRTLTVESGNYYSVGTNRLIEKNGVL